MQRNWKLQQKRSSVKKKKRVCASFSVGAGLTSLCVSLAGRERAPAMCCNDAGLRSGSTNVGRGIRESGLCEPSGSGTTGVGGGDGGGEVL